MPVVHCTALQAWGYVWCLESQINDSGGPYAPIPAEMACHGRRRSVPCNMPGAPSAGDNERLLTSTGTAAKVASYARALSAAAALLAVRNAAGVGND